MENEIVEGSLLPGDKESAVELVLRKYGRKLR